MIAPEDPFALAFDAITPDPALAARTLDDPALTIPFVQGETDEAGPDGPGFYLLDDADGRFVIDHDMGVISIADDALLETEYDAIHAARIKVIERSGAEYELTLRLRLAGHVPQVVAADDEIEETPAIALAPDVQSQAPPPPVSVAAPTVSFTDFAAFSFARVEALGEENAAFGALIAPRPVAEPEAFALGFDAALPAPAPHTADWSL